MTKLGKGEEVMASLVSGWAIDLEPGYVEARDGAGLLQIVLLKQAAGQGDKKAEEKLKSLARTAPAA